MSNRIKFYGSQGIFNLKRSTFIIVGLGFAISMLAGLFFMGNSYSAELIKSMDNSDIDFYFAYTYNEINHNQDEELINLIEQSDIEVKSLHSFRISRYSEIFYYFNQTSIPTADRVVPYDYVVNSFNYNLFSSVFYQSEVISNLITLTEGHYPSAPNEIIIDSYFAKSMNLSVQSEVNLDIIGKSNDFADFGNYYQISNYTFLQSIDNITISGIFEMNDKVIDFVYSKYYANYEHNSQSGNLIEHLSGILNTPILGFSYFDQRDVNHPFIQFSSAIDFYFNSKVQKSGLFGYLDKNKINYKKLTSEITSLSNNFLVIRQNTPIGIIFNEEVVDQLQEIYSLQRRLNIELQLINIPLGLFAIILGSLAIKNNIKGRMEEFLLFRSKGTPNHMLRKQIMSESFFIGVAASLVGILGGIGVFFILRNSIQTALGLQFLFMNLPLSIKFTTILLIIAIGIILSEVSSLFSFVYIRKLTSFELLKIIGKDEMDVSYDEKSLFSNQTKKKAVLLNDTPFQKSQRKDGKKFNSKNKWSRKKTLYKDDIDSKNVSVKKRGWTFIVISSIPLLLFLFFRYVVPTSVSDNIVAITPSISRFIENNYFILLIAPILFVMGFIRILAVESPNRFARLTNKIAMLFEKENSRICAVNIIRRKPYYTVMTIFCIFLSIFSLASISLNSLIIYENIDSNIQIGGDVRLSFPFISYDSSELGTGGLFGNYQISSNQDILQLEENLKTVNLGNNFNLSNEVVTVFEEITNIYHLKVMYLDFAKYAYIMSEGDKFIPEKQTQTKLSEVINFNSVDNLDAPGIIVNSRFLELNRREINDPFLFEHKFWNNSINDMDSIILNSTIIETIDILPGLYGFESTVNEWEDAVLIFDTRKLPFQNSSNILNTLSFFQILDILPQEISPDFLMGLLSSQINQTQYQEISIYNQDWRNLDSDVSTRFSKFRTILITEFYAIGILVAFGLSVLIISVFKKDKFFNGVLLARGYGKIGVFNLTLVEFFIIFIIPILINIFQGLIFIKPLLSLVNEALGLFSFTWNLPLYVNFQDLLVYALFVPFFTTLIFTIAFSFQTKKTISQFFYKF